MWYNHPFNCTISTNIYRKFLTILEENISASSVKIWVSYSTLPNLGTIIAHLSRTNIIAASESNNCNGNSKLTPSNNSKNYIYVNIKNTNDSTDNPDLVSDNIDCIVNNNEDNVLPEFPWYSICNH